MSIGRLKIGAALVLTSPFTPMLFQGEEWGASAPFFYFTDYQEPELARAVREGRCREFEAFGWKPQDTSDPQARDTFVRSILNWYECVAAACRQISGPGTGGLNSTAFRCAAVATDAGRMQSRGKLNWDEIQCC